MEKKFLDKQGLVELNKSFKDKFARKSDVPVKVSQLENDSQFTTLIEAKNDIGLLLLQQYKAQQTPQNKTSLGAVYVERINRVTDNPCLIFTYLTQQLNGNTEYEALQIAIELKTRRAFTRTAEQSRLFPTKLEIKSATWSKWQEETNPIKEVPTKLSQLENDKNYVDITKVNELILQASGLKKEVYDTLPAQGKDNVLYLIKDSKGKENNIYLEYLWVDNKFELIGSTDVDLSQYAKKNELSSYAKQEDIKTKLSELTDDPTHRTVTDEEKNKWNKIKPSRTATFVIANYDSSKKSKSGADYVVKEYDSLCHIINEVIGSLPSCGGTIQLTEGNFVVTDDTAIALYKDNVTLKGYGNATRLEMKGDKGAHLIEITSSNSIVKNICCTANHNIGILFDSNSTHCQMINVTVTNTNIAFRIDGKGHMLSNCVGISSVRNSVAMIIYGCNHVLKNCQGIVTNYDSDAFIAVQASKISFIDCIGRSKDGTFKGCSFKIQHSTDCKFTNCIGETENYATFFIFGSSHNSFINCTGTNSQGSVLPVFLINGDANNVTAGNIFNTCRAVTNKENAQSQFKLDEYTRFNIIISCTMQNMSVLDEGQNNVIANNIIIK